jgi:hypothetical protein
MTKKHKMEYEDFLKVILGLQKENRVISELYDRNVDLIEFVDPYHGIIFVLFETIYGEKGLDWFTWFCYENDFGQKSWTDSEGNPTSGATDEKGNPICYSFESLWEFLEGLEDA